MTWWNDRQPTSRKEDDFRSDLRSKALRFDDRVTPRRKEIRHPLDELFQERFRRPKRDFANDLAGNELQQTAVKRAALWECVKAADCPQASLNDTEDGRQLHAIQAAWSSLPLEVRAAIVAIVQAAVPKVGPPTSSD